MEACLPLDKVDKCIGIISDFLKRKKVTLREVQSLTGFLNFACSVIVPGRAFLLYSPDVERLWEGGFPTRQPATSDLTYFAQFSPGCCCGGHL